MALSIYVVWFGLFMAASVSMVLCNKLVMQTFPYPNVLLIIQNTMTVLLNVLGCRVGVFSMEPWKLAHFRVWLLPTVLFSVMLVTSLKALPMVAVATTVVFRNVGTVVVATGDALFFGKEFQRDMKLGLGVILVGSVVYSSFDMNFDPVGYMWLSANTLLHSGNALYEKYAVVSVDQTAVGVSCYQNILSLPLLLVVMLLGGETAALTTYEDVPLPIRGVIVLTGFFGCLLSVCYMSLNKFASPTAITIANNLNRLVSAVLGSIVFKNAVSAQAVAGLLICMAGGYMYSVASSRKPADPVIEDKEVPMEDLSTEKTGGKTS